MLIAWGSTSEPRSTQCPMSRSRGHAFVVFSTLVLSVFFCVCSWSCLTQCGQQRGHKLPRSFGCEWGRRHECGAALAQSKVSSGCPSQSCGMESDGRWAWAGSFFLWLLSESTVKS